MRVWLQTLSLVKMNLCFRRHWMSCQCVKMRVLTHLRAPCNNPGIMIKNIISIIQRNLICWWSFLILLFPRLVRVSRRSVRSTSSTPSWTWTSRFLSSTSAPSSSETIHTLTCVYPMTPSYSIRWGPPPPSITLSSSVRLSNASSIFASLQAPSSARDPSRVVLNDGSCWTIIGVEAVEFTFNQGLACIQTPVTPFPVITGLEVS